MHSKIFPRKAVYLALKPNLPGSLSRMSRMSKMSGNILTAVKHSGLSYNMRTLWKYPAFPENPQNNYGSFKTNFKKKTVRPDAFLDNNFQGFLRIFPHCRQSILTFFTNSEQFANLPDYLETVRSIKKNLMDIQRK